MKFSQKILSFSWMLINFIFIQACEHEEKICLKKRPSFTTQTKSIEEEEEPTPTIESVNRISIKTVEDFNQAFPHASVKNERSLDDTDTGIILSREKVEQEQQQIVALPTENQAIKIQRAWRSKRSFKNLQNLQEIKQNIDDDENDSQNSSIKAVKDYDSGYGSDNEESEYINGPENVESPLSSPPKDDDSNFRYIQKILNDKEITNKELEILKNSLIKFQAVIRGKLSRKKAKKYKNEQDDSSGHQPDNKEKSKENFNKVLCELLSSQRQEILVHNEENSQISPITNEQDFSSGHQSDNKKSGIVDLPKVDLEKREELKALNLPETTESPVINDNDYENQTSENFYINEYEKEQTNLNFIRRSRSFDDTLLISLPTWLLNQCGYMPAHQKLQLYKNYFLEKFAEIITPDAAEQIAAAQSLQEVDIIIEYLKKDTSAA